MYPDRSDCNNAGIEFVLIDLDVAVTFMDVAAVSRLQETIDRNHKNARHAYDSVLRLLRNLRPDAAQRGAIDRKITVLKARLEAVGVEF